MSTPMPNTASSIAVNGPLGANDQEPRQMAGVAEASGGGPSAAPVNDSPLMQDMQNALKQMQDAFKQMHAISQGVQATAPVSSTPTLIPNDPHVDIKLRTPGDTLKLIAMGKEKILNLLRALNGAWADLLDVQFEFDSGYHQSPDELESPETLAHETHVPERRLRLVFGTVASEQAVRKLGHEATETLELSTNCGVIPQRYHVQIVGYVQVKGNDTREYLDMWCRDLHEVDVVAHFWTYGKLILSFSNINHAKKLCERGVTIRQKAYTVQYVLCILVSKRDCADANMKQIGPLIGGRCPSSVSSASSLATSSRNALQRPSHVVGAQGHTMFEHAPKEHRRSAPTVQGHMKLGHTTARTQIL